MGLPRRSARARGTSISLRESDAASAGLDEWKGVWECRYFVGSVPAEFAPERLERLLGRPNGPFMDEDVYVVGEDRGTNVKLRRRTGTLKVKTLTERTDDGFELWRTVSDSRLPAAKQVWEDALRKLGVERDPGRLQESLDAREIDELCKREGEITCVVTAKRRLFYSREGARIEVTDVAALGMRVTSISFEATDVERARALRTALGGERLGEPENYVSVVARLRRESA